MLTIGETMQVSQVGLGCMRMSGLSEKDAQAVIHTALDNGINFFDHADIYGGGKAEEIFGAILQKAPSLREQMIVQDKCGICNGYYDSSKEHILRSVEASLKRLHTDHLDVLLLHRPDALMEPEEIADAFHQLHESGKVRAFGVSNMNTAQIELLSQAMPGVLQVDQLQFGLAHSGLVDEGINVNTDAEQAIVRTGSVLDYCRLRKMRVQAWSPLQFGMFEGPFLRSEQYAPLNKLVHEMAQRYQVEDIAIALAWILRHPAGIQAILGSMNPERIKAAATAQCMTLTREEWYQLYREAGNSIP